MRIKKTRDRNEYLLTQDKLWVRNFTKYGPPPVTLNPTPDQQLYLANELANGQARLPWIGAGDAAFDEFIVVSDGPGFADALKLLKDIPQGTVVVAVNGALKKWSGRAPHYYVVNNPYKECLNFLPAGQSPRCIASSRTNPQFLRQYRGAKYLYAPVCGHDYTGPAPPGVARLDDLRNPVCAAIALGHLWGVRKLHLMCCQEWYAEKRPGMIESEGRWQYPAQKTANDLIAAQLYWMSQFQP